MPYNCFQLKLYNAVIDDVITNVRDGFLDEGVDEQVLQEIKQVWTTKLMASKAVELALDPPEPQPPPIVAGATKVCENSHDLKTILILYCICLIIHVMDLLFFFSLIDNLLCSPR